MVDGDAWLGETPAAWMRPVTSPSAVAVWRSACTDLRDDTSTVAVLTSNPALLNTSAAASAFSWRKSASTTCLPALTRRAIAWPIDPGPMTTTTLLITMPFREVGERRDLRRYRSHGGGVTLPDLSIAYAAQHAAEERLAAYAAAPGMAVRRGRDWFAVRTGVDSNDMNGVVSEAQAEISADLVEDLVGWFRA